MRIFLRSRHLGGLTRNLFQQRYARLGTHLVQTSVWVDDYISPLTRQKHTIAYQCLHVVGSERHLSGSAAEVKGHDRRVDVMQFWTEKVDGIPGEQTLVSVVQHWDRIFRHCSEAITWLLLQKLQGSEVPNLYKELSPTSVWQIWEYCRLLLWEVVWGQRWPWVLCSFRSPCVQELSIMLWRGEGRDLEPLLTSCGHNMKDQDWHNESFRFLRIFGAFFRPLALRMRRCGFWCQCCRRRTLSRTSCSS